MSLTQKMDELAAIARLDPGTRICYYRGDLARDRQKLKVILDLRSDEVAHLAAFALKLARAGHCTLTQKRHGDHDYEYFAVATMAKHTELAEIVLKRYSK